MNPFHSPARTSASIDEESEARENQAFMQTLDPAIATAAEWHTRREDGLDSRDEARFQRWLAADPAHEVAYAQLDGSYSAVRELQPAQVAHLRVHAASVAVAHVTGAASQWRSRKLDRLGGRAESARSWLMPKAAGLAAACVVAAASVFGWYGWHQPIFTDHYATARGQRLDTDLPDGSQLKLDAATRAEVVLYRDRREARLDEGQAMFIVAPDAGKPFRVTAGAARITVVGTRFSVRHTASRDDPGAVEVAVEEGTVQVESTQQAGGDASVAILMPGQAVQLSGSGRLGAVISVPVSAVALWRKGMVRFSDTPLSEAIYELERYGPTHLVVRDPRVAELRIGGSFEVARPDQLAAVLPSILPVKLVPRANDTQEVVSLR